MDEFVTELRFPVGYAKRERGRKNERMELGIKLFRVELMNPVPCAMGEKCLQGREEKPANAWNKYVDRLFPIEGRNEAAACCMDCALLLAMEW